MTAESEPGLSRGRNRPRRGWRTALGVAALTGFYLMGAVLLTGAALAHAPSSAVMSKSTTMASTAAVVPSDNATGNNTSGENDQGDNSSGDNDQGDNSTGENDQGDQGNATVCASSENDNSQGDQGSTNSSSGDLPGTSVTSADNGTGNDTGNETGDSDGNETGDSQGNDTGGAPSGNCSGDPPVTFKALGLPSGSTWSVTAGNPAVTLTNTTVGHKGMVVFNVTNGTLNYTIHPPAGFGVQKVVGPGSPSQTSDMISGTTVLTVKFSVFQNLTFVEKGLPAGSVWAVMIWSSLPHGGPPSQSGTNTTTASGGAIVFSVVKGSWKFNITEVPANFTAHPSHGSVGVAGHPVTRHLRFHPMVAPALPAIHPDLLWAAVARIS